MTTSTWGQPGSASPGLLLSQLDAEGRTTTYEYDNAGNRTAQVVDSGAGRLNLRTTWTYDGVGNATSVVGPRGNAAGANPDTFRVTQVFDRKRRLIQSYQLSTQSQTVYDYDADDRPTSVQRLAWDAIRPATMLTTTTTYTPTGQRAVVTDPSGNTLTYGYDGADRLVTVTRSSGRQVRTVYDIVSRIVEIREQVSGTLDPSITVNRGDVLRETRAYTANSLLATQADGNGNTLAYSYDGFDRLVRTTYPPAGAPPALFEEYGYDLNGNRTQHRTRAGQDIALAYDALDRLMSRAVPANANAPAVTYTHGYDLVGRLLRLRQSTDAADVVYAYDTAGRLTGETRPDGRAIGYLRDADGSLTRLTWPTEAGDAYAVTYVYDALGRTTGAFEGTDASGLRLGGYSYDTASRRIALDRGNAARTSWGWRPDGLVQDLAHGFAGGASVAFTYLYNREGGLSARLVSDAAWQATPALQAATIYGANALNQYATVGGVAFSYDANGNLTSDGTTTYRYDPQNRLVGFTQGAVTVGYAYDAEGRRASRTAGAATTRFLYALGQEIAEYDGAGALAARHVPGPGQDEPLATVTGAPAARVRAWYHADAQGSAIGRSDATGSVPAGERFTYTPYGVAGSGSGAAAAFRFVGRRFEPDAGLYDMRARVYAPALGRFLQADPIGTEGGINLYAYVGNDPLNGADPSGLVMEAAANLGQRAIGPYVSAYQHIIVEPLNAGIGAIARSPVGDPGLYASLQGLGPPGAIVGGVGRLGATGLRALAGVGPSSQAARAAEELTRVGRWMSPAEFETMSNTGRVVEGAGGRTSAIRPPNPGSYTAAPPGSVYAEFDVPSSMLRQGGRPDWVIIPGPNVTTRMFGPAPSEAAPATCIICVIGR